LLEVAPLEYEGVRPRGRYCTIPIRAGNQTSAAADPRPDDALNHINASIGPAH
jgi:hypothetical protein